MYALLENGSIFGKECEQLLQFAKYVLRATIQGLSGPIFRLADSSGNPKTGRSTATRHNHFHQWIVSNHSNPAHGNTKPLGHESESVKGRLASQNHGRVR